MNPNEEKEFKEYLKDNTPDLWAKIDSNLPTGMYTHNSLDTETTSQKEKDSHTETDNKDDVDAPSSKKVVKFKRKKIYAISTALAACLILASLTAVSYMLDSNSNRLESAKNISGITSNIAEKKDEDASDSSPEYALNSDNVSSDTKSDTMDESIIDSNNVTNNEEPSLGTDNSIDKDSNTQNETSIEIKLRIIVTKTHNTEAGLIYQGMVIYTTSTKLKLQDTVYVSLRNLTRHDLKHTYAPKELFTVSIQDDSYTSTLDKPYLATKMIEGYKE